MTRAMAAFTVETFIAIISFVGIVFFTNHINIFPVLSPFMMLMFTISLFMMGYLSRGTLEEIEEEQLKRGKYDFY